MIRLQNHHEINPTLREHVTGMKIDQATSSFSFVLNAVQNLSLAMSHGKINFIIVEFPGIPFLVKTVS
jgi:hypothetical protein